MEKNKSETIKSEENHKNGTFYRVLIFILAILIILLIWQQRINLHRLSRMGYIGIFLVNFVSSATVLVPLPGVASVAIGGALWNPLMVGIFSGIGATLGEVMGYILGFGGRGLIKTYEKKIKWFSQMEGFFQSRGFLAIFLFALIPNPVFDFIGIIAGAVNYPVLKYALATLIGRVIRNTIIAWSGARFLPL